MTNGPAPKNLPEDTQRAINLLYDYSADAIYTSRSKEEVYEEGFSVDTENCFMFAFYINNKES